jgi:hypothetical protein
VRFNAGCRRGEEGQGDARSAHLVNLIDRKIAAFGGHAVSPLPGAKARPDAVDGVILPQGEICCRFAVFLRSPDSPVQLLMQVTIGWRGSIFAGWRARAAADEGTQ